MSKLPVLLNCVVVVLALGAGYAGVGQGIAEESKVVGNKVALARQITEPRVWTSANAWTPTFTDDTVFNWLWEQRRVASDPVAAAVRRQLDGGLIAGAVVASGTRAPTAFGDQCRVARKTAMSADSRFDIASVTKTFVAVLCARLATQGKLDVDAPFTRYLPDHVLAKEGCAITVRDLAMHTSGFAYETCYQYAKDPAEIRAKAMSCRPQWPRLEKFNYSCLNYVYLGWIAEKVTGMTLDKAVKAYVLDPLGMKATSWGPVSDDGTVVELPVMVELGKKGDAYRPGYNAAIGQISDCGANMASPHAVGNAGLFSTAGDLRLYVQDLLARKTFEPAAYDLLFTCAYEKDGARRSFGFDMCAEKCPQGLSDRTIYHSGWSGQTIAIDPGTGFCGVCLTARAGDHGASLRGRMEILSLAASVARTDSFFAAVKDAAAGFWRRITGREMPAGAVEFAIDPSVSKTGADAYEIRSEKAYGVKITGSNERSVWYGLYDLLERRGGCGWFWDGDRVPKKGTIDLSGLDVREESKFAYRGIRYFAHRGLTRFQAEHWGFDDWKREIDWCLKKRLNLFMLRIGQDDYFQKAFPDVCAYPDASKPLPGQHDRYDNRSLFWPLEFRGELRKKVMEYAFARGMMAPEDFGTMTHWYSRTPQDFLEKMKPDFLPQAPGAYGEPSGLVWDIRQKKWMDAYWRLTDTGIREYGRPGLLHTIGIAERRISTNRLENLKMKTEWTNMLLSEAKTRHPESVRLLAGWDLYCMKTPDEVRNFLKGIPEDVVIWDYEADASINTWFGEWDIVGKRPYVFGVFMAYEAGLDPRTDYAKIAARQKLVENDPMCKGYILWPESSHVDSMGLEWFAKNAWRADAPEVAPVVADVCTRRYPDEAAAMRELWMKTIPVSTNMQNTWRWNAFLPILREMNEGLVSTNECDRWPAPKPDAFFADLPKVVATLKGLDWEKDELLKRDMTDLARVWADRLAVEAENRMFTAYLRWLGGDESAAEDVWRNGALAVARLNALAELLALHEDFSICDTYDHLCAIQPVALPTFASVLVDNVANYYCTSHQAELARHCYIPAFEHYLDVIKKRMLANDRTPPAKKCLDAYRKRAMKMGFDELRLKVPRTRESFNAALDRILASSAPHAREPVGRGRPDITNKDGALFKR